MNLFLAAILSLVAGAFVSGFLYFKQSEFEQKWLVVLLATLRGFAFALLAFVLLAPFINLKKKEISKPIIAVLVDDSQSMLLSPDSATLKKELVSRLNLASEIVQNAEVKFFAFDTELSESMPDFTGSATDVSNVLRSVKKQIPKDRLGAVVLVSDGLYNRGSNPLYETEGSLVPVYALAVGDSSRQSDVGITEVLAPQFVFRGDDAVIDVTVAAENVGGAKSTLRLKQNNAVLGIKVLNVATNSFATVQQFRIKTEKAGVFAYDVAVDQLPQERNVRNNVQRFYIEVIENRKQITVLAGAPSPDVAALREALKKIDAYDVRYQDAGKGVALDANTELTIVFLQSNIAPSVYKNVLANVKGALWLVIDPEFDTRSLPRIWPEVGVNNQRLPVKSKPQLNTDFGLFGLSAETKDVLSQLPQTPILEGQIVTSQPSEVLLKGAGGQKLALYGSHGQGRLVVFGFGGLWHMRTQSFVAHQSHQNFDEWLQLTAQYLLAAGNSNRLRLYYEPNQPAGENITIKAEVYDAAFKNTTNATVNLEVISAAGSRNDFAFTAGTSNYSVQLSALPPGQYQLKATAKLGQETLRAEGELRIADQSLESLSTRANYEMLQQLASSSAGEFYVFGQEKELFTHINGRESVKPVVRISKTAMPLIDITWLLFLATLFFAAEWLLRRYFGRI